MSLIIIPEMPHVEERPTPDTEEAVEVEVEMEAEEPRVEEEPPLVRRWIEPEEMGEDLARRPVINSLNPFYLPMGEEIRHEMHRIDYHVNLQPIVTPRVHRQMIIEEPREETTLPSRQWLEQVVGGDRVVARPMTMPALVEEPEPIIRNVRRE